MKQLPKRGKKKFPKCKKASRKTKRTVSLPGQRKDLTSKLFILGKGACCAGHRRDESCRGVQWEGDKFLWADVELSIVFRAGGPFDIGPPTLKTMLHLILPKVPGGVSRPSLSLTNLKQQKWSYKPGYKRNHILHTQEHLPLKNNCSDSFGGW